MKWFNNLKNRINSKDLPKNLDIHGVICDCGYEDMSVQYIDYEKYIGKGCPKCGKELLTMKEYKDVLLLIKTVRIMNELSFQSNENK